MFKCKFLTLVLVLISTMLNGSISIKLIDGVSENCDEIIYEVLKIQNSLVQPLQVNDIAKQGFLTIRMTPEYLKDFLKTGQIIVAYSNDNVVGYLLLIDIENFLAWAESRKLDSDWDLKSLKDTKYIDQIAVAIPFAHQGIGTLLVNYAKELSPKGLLTDILLEPTPNVAPLEFFSKCDFKTIGTIQIEDYHDLSPHKTSILLWLDKIK